MDLSCLEIIIGSAVGGLSVDYAAGFQLGKTRVVGSLELSCSIYVKEVIKFNKKHNIKVQPPKLKTNSIGGKVVQVACHKINHQTSKCEFNGKKCILLN